MIAINLIRGGAPSWSDNGGQEVFCKVLPDRPFGLSFNSASTLPPSLHPRLMERILGKSPLRLILSRTLVCRGCYQETLECGHELTTYQEFLWDEKAHLVLLEPTAKRRRCQECKAAAAQDPTRKAVVPMGIHATPGACRRGDADTDSIRGCRLESGETGARTASGGQSTIDECTTPESLPDSSSPGLEFPSPKKPPQSVRRNEKRRRA
jgi:hypothetical protein